MNIVLTNQIFLFKHRLLFVTISFFLNQVTNLLEAYSNFHHVSVILFNFITFENLRSSWGMMTETQW